MLRAIGSLVRSSELSTTWFRTLTSQSVAKMALPEGPATHETDKWMPEYELQDTTAYVMEALEHYHVPSGVLKAIIHPDREVSVQLPLALDNGEIQLIPAYLIQHNNVRGPFKGGLIFHQDVTPEGLRSLAALNTWKTALMDVPFGGAKLGVAVDPRLLTIREQEKVTRKLVTALQSLLGPTECIPAPDIGTDERHMSWIFDQFSRLRGFSPAVVSGKPVWLHGCQGRERAAGWGAALMCREFMRKIMHKRVAGSTFIIQGFGKNGSWAAESLYQQGGKIIGVSSSETAVMNKDGLDITALRAHTAQGKYLAEFPGGQPVPNDDSFLEIPCDVVLPAAVSGTITAKTAPRLQCTAVVEASNSGITPEGNKILASRGIAVCPDVVVCGGGVVVSFFEWVQNMNHQIWDVDEVMRKQERYMTHAFNEMCTVARDKGVSLRTAAYCVALKSIARADANRGHG